MVDMEGAVAKTDFTISTAAKQHAYVKKYIVDPGVQPPLIKPPEIIEIEEMVEISIIEAEIPVTIAFIKTNITEITITTLKDAVNLLLRVQQLIERPQEVSIPPYIIYRYFNIVLENIEPHYLKETTITFKVERVWIDEMDIDADTIRLNAFNIETGIWNPLPTQIINYDDIYIFYSAVTPQFQIFVITGKEILPPVIPVIEPPILISIAISPKEITLYIGETIQFIATIYPKNANQRVTWIVEDPEIGMIDENGLFTALSMGVTNIIATSVIDPEIYGTAVATVKEMVIEPEPLPIVPHWKWIALAFLIIMIIVVVIFLKNKKIEIFPKEITLYIGETIQFIATIYPKNANQRVTWIVENSEIGMIDENGLFTALATGTTTIIATSVINSKIYKAVVVIVEKQGV